MKHLNYIIFTLALSVVSGAVWAEKIAVVNIQAAILESTYGQAELAKLEQDVGYSALVNEAQTLVADVQALDKEAQSNRGEWSADEVAEYQKQRQFLTADLQLNQQKIQTERERVVRQINATMNQAALAALQELVQEDGISLLLQENAVYHATDDHNVTAKLVAKLSE